MRHRLFHSRKVVYFTLFIFFILLVNTSYSRAPVRDEQQADSIFKEGVELYNLGEYLNAIEKFSQVLILTQEKGLLIDTYFHLSMCNFYLGETQSTKDWIRRINVVTSGNNSKVQYLIAL